MASIRRWLAILNSLPLHPLRKGQKRRACGGDDLVGHSASAHQAFEPREKEAPPCPRALPVAAKEGCAAALSDAEPFAQHRGDELPAEAGALDHVEAARQLLPGREARQIGAARQAGNLLARQANRPEIALDESRALPQREPEREGGRCHADHTSFKRGIEAEEQFENPAITIEREVGIEQPQPGLETPMQIGGFALSP